VTSRAGGGKAARVATIAEANEKMEMKMKMKQAAY